MSSIIPYKALALQLTCESVNECTPAEAKTKMMQSLKRVGKQLNASKAFIGKDLKLVVLPEYFLTGFPMGESIPEWQEKGCIESGDQVYKAIAAIASDAQVYLSGNVYEIDKNFPSLYFQASFIMNPKGELVLRYHRLNSMFAASPHDVLDKYINLYGKESFFPVVKTEIGNLACIASEEILYPEIARCLVMNGAEIFLHSSSEVGSPMLTQKNVAKMARAIENMAYVISSNSAGISGYSIPTSSTDGSSQIINYEGLKLCEAGYGESMVANTTIHMNELRHHRNRPGMGNFISRQRFELFTDTYKQSIYPANSLSETLPDRTHFIDQQNKVIKYLKDKGIIN